MSYELLDADGSMPFYQAVSGGVKTVGSDLQSYNQVRPNTGAVVQTPGGLSNQYHGHPQGPYSDTATKTNMFGYSYPFPKRQPQGNFYEEGLSYNENTLIEGPDPNAYYQSKRTSSNRIENFQLPGGDDYDAITDEDDDSSPASSSDKSKKITSNVPKDSLTFGLQFLAIIALLIVLFFVLDSWNKFGFNAIREYIFKGRILRTWNLGAIALVGTIVLVLLIWFIGIPFIKTE